MLPTSSSESSFPLDQDASFETVAPIESNPELIKIEGVNSNAEAPQADAHILPVVGLGGSAGSISALQSFFSRIPPDLGIAYVVVIHLSPEHESSLAEILSTQTTMPVAQIQSSTRLEANRVYVIPPSHHLAMQDGQIHLTEPQQETGQRVAVDLFFRSLALTHRSKSVAVVLSGADSDGAIGIKRIKEQGGVTIAQDPDEAEQEGMPRSAIETGMVDWILSVEQMAKKLTEWIANENRIHLPPSESSQSISEVQIKDPDENSLREVLSFLHARTSHDFSHYKRATVLRRIMRRLQVNSLESLPAYANFLRTHPGEAGALLQDLLISVTNFFRDPESFWSLQGYIPQLFRGKHGNDAVRVWVAGCATGEEAYSLAMLLLEHSDTLDSAPEIQIFATDLDDQALRFAREGVYPATITADVSPERLRRFFVLDQGRYRIKKEIRERILFASHNLLKDAPFSRLDMVSCRNLMIYFDREAQGRVLELFHFALKASGLLFLGGSESADDNPLFRVKDKKHRLYERHSLAQPLFPVPSLPLPVTVPRLPDMVRSADIASLVHVVPTNRIPSPLPTSASEEARGTESKPYSFGELHFQMLEHLAPPSVLVDSNSDIVHLSERAGHYLQLRGGVGSFNLLNLVPVPLRAELRIALLRALQNGEDIDLPGVSLPWGGEQRNIVVRVRPLYQNNSRPDGRSDGRNDPNTFAVVIFDEPRDQEASVTMLASLPSDDTVQRLEAELERTKNYLRASVEQFEASSEELKASNEELQAMNEEQRSASEELETSREEIQAANEELTTLNQELKSKIEEISRTNNDLQNLMASTDIATIFLNRELRIKRYTPPAVELFRLIPTDTGRPLADLRNRFEDAQLLEDAERSLRTLLPIEREIRTSDGRWFLLRIAPYRTLEDHIDGVVLSFIDISSRKQAEQALRESEERLRTLFDSMSEAFVIKEAIVDEAGRVVDYQFVESNPAFALQTGLGDPRGHTMMELMPDIEPIWLESYEQVIQTGKPTQFEAHIGPLNRWLSVSASRLGGSGSRRVAIVFSDVTERRGAQEALLESEEQFQRAIQEAPIPVIMYAEDGQVLQISRTWTELTGYALEDVPTFEAWLGRTYGEGSEHLRNHMQALFEGEQRTLNVDVSIQTREGDLRHWSFSASSPGTLKDGRRFIVAMAVDITERKDTEEALRESEERLRFLVEGTQDYAMFLMDPRRRIFHWNSGAQRLFGYSREEMIEQAGDIIFTPEDREAAVPEAEAQQAIEQGSSPDVRWHQRQDGSRFWSDGINTCLRSETGELLGFAKILRDATREREAEDALHQAHEELEQRVQERTQELSTEIVQRQQLEEERSQLTQRIVNVQEEERRRISRELHDNMGQHLTAIMMALQSLQKPDPHPEGERRDNATTITRLSAMVEDLTGIAHRLAWELRPAALDNVGLEAALEQYVKDWAKKSGIATDFASNSHGATPTSASPTAGSTLSSERATALYRVMQEALTNVLRHAGASRVSVILEQNANFVSAIIEDNGRGFDVEAIASSKRLGVWGMQERLELVGGSLEVESVPGEGTTIYARVPLETGTSEG